jgi:MFS family permease
MGSNHAYTPLTAEYDIDETPHQESGDSHSPTSSSSSPSAFHGSRTKSPLAMASSHGESSRVHNLKLLSSYDSSVSKTIVNTESSQVQRWDTDHPDTPFIDHEDPDASEEPDGPRYRVYKQRWFGLAQLVLLNIIVSWDWLTFAALSSTAADYFDVSETAINWLSTAFLFAFAVSAPATIWVLNHHGPKVSILTASALVLVGNWIRYGGTRSGANGNFPVVMFGQVIIGLSQPFVLAAPTRYSNMWFSDSGRIGATALPSLANPLGGALGQLIGPLLATDTSGVPSMVLYTAIISSVASIPSMFISAGPPTPPSATAAAEKLDLPAAFRSLARNANFYLVLIPFAIYVGCFNSTSTLLNQILEPYGFSETEAGVSGALLIFVGLGVSAVVSPMVDRTKAYLATLKTLVPVLAICYTALIFMPGTESAAGPYIICALLGAASFSLLPMTLELLTITTFPVSPEVSSVVAWTAGQILGAIFVVVMKAMESNGYDDEPPGSLKAALIFQAAIAWIGVPLSLLLGVWKFKQAPGAGPPAI